MKNYGVAVFRRFLRKFSRWVILTDGGTVSPTQNVLFDAVPLPSFNVE